MTAAISGRGETERDTAEARAQCVESGERDDHAPVGRGAEREPRIAMIEAHTEPGVRSGSGTVPSSSSIG